VDVVALGGHDDRAAGLFDGPSDEVLRSLVVGRGVDDVHAQLESSKQTLDRLPLRHEPQLVGPEPDDRDFETGPAESPILHC
jgi:hypothetical protein